jgi:hypothetical protein
MLEGLKQNTEVVLLCHVRYTEMSNTFIFRGSVISIVCCNCICYFLYSLKLTGWVMWLFLKSLPGICGAFYCQMLIICYHCQLNDIFWRKYMRPSLLQKIQGLKTVVFYWCLWGENKHVFYWCLWGENKHTRQNGWYSISVSYQQTFRKLRK